MSLWAAFPPELFLKAVEFMDVPQLLALLSVSHRCRVLGEAELYKSVTITTESPALPRMANFYDTITTRSDLAARVKTLVLILEYGLPSRRRFFPSRNFPETLIRDILCKLPNLQRVSVRCPPLSSLDLPNSESVLPPFSLTHFRWHNHVLSEDVRLFRAFLKSQSSLQFIDIMRSGIRSLRLSERALPCLHTLLADDDTACDILAARRIPHLVVTIEDGNSIARPASAQHVRSLECSGETLQSVVAFAAQFQNLECLSLHFSSTTGGNVAGMATEALTLLQSFSCKKIKYISITSEFYIGSQVVDNAPAVFQALPMLQAIDIVKDNGKVVLRSQARPNTYLRYTRGSSAHHLPEGIRPEVDVHGWDLWWQDCGIDFTVDANTGTDTHII